MPRHTVNGVELYYELAGHGDPLVLVHGSWTDHTSWRFIADTLAESYRVLTYDRRGHSRSERPDGQGSRRQDEDDLVSLIEALELAPVHVVGNSLGAAIALGAAAGRPDLIRQVIAHEPPMLGIAHPGSDLSRQLEPVLATIDTVAARLRRGDTERAVAQFVEDVAIGPGTWVTLPEETRRTMIANGPTFLDEAGDPEWGAARAAPDPSVGVLLTDGAMSPAWLPAIVAEINATTHPHAARHTFAEAGHVPHLTHPDELVDVVSTFLDGSVAALGSHERSGGQ